MELIIILVIAAIIFAVLLAVAVSRMCCSLLTVYSEYKKTREPEEVASTESTRSDTNSTIKTEKLALIDDNARLERELGIRLHDYPFTVNYNRALPLLNISTKAGAADGQNDDDDSQELGSDSPSSFPALNAG